MHSSPPKPTSISIPAAGPHTGPHTGPDTGPDPGTALPLSLGEQSVHEFEGDYAPPPTATLVPANPRTEPLQVDFLHRLADALNTTLDLQALMHRVADLVRAVIDYRIFAILLLNDRTNELWMRFQTGHNPETERLRIKLGRGVTGVAARERRSILIEDVHLFEPYINANPEVLSELAVPLIVKNKVIGVIDIQSESPAFFTAEHQRLLEDVASRVAIAIENARLYTRVSRQAQTLAVLNDISREITSILDLDDLLERIGQLLKRVIDFQMFTILLWNERTEQFEHRFSSRYGEQIQRGRTVRLNEGLIGTAAAERTPILATDVRKDPRYVAENPETRSELAVPLIYKGKVIGVLDLEHTRLNYYNDDHQRTLSTLAAQVAISIANASLYQRIHDEEQRMERDLQMAREVQLRLLPSSPPRPQNAEISARFHAARAIGGDVYDFLDYGRESPENRDASPGNRDAIPGNRDAIPGNRDAISPEPGGRRIAIALGDVSGKAAPAALYAALVSGILRSLAPQHLSPAALLTALNDQLQERKLDAQYVTMLIALWDDSNRTLQVANAGSVQPLFVSRAPTGEVNVHTIKAVGFPLGLFPEVTYEEFTLSTRAGDLIVFFSDGILDAENSTGEMFGEERLCSLLQNEPAATSTSDSAIETIMAAVARFQSGTDHFDDETLVILRVL